jgi:hypothetical protein
MSLSARPCAIGLVAFLLVRDAVRQLRVVEDGGMAVELDPERLATGRRGWHAVAELLLAGPQHRRTGTIRLRVAPGGFATTKEPDLRVDGHHLVAGGRRIPLDGASLAELGQAAGIDAGAPQGLYRDGSGAGLDEVVRVEPAVATHLANCLALGDKALRVLPGAQQPVLWPEHFDLAITLDEVNYGISLGDSWLGEPYAYIGPWKLPRGDFWNAPFGAGRALRDLPDLDAVSAFFAQARSSLPHSQRP